MANPYIDTILEADVRLEPKQMNNHIIDNIKDNLNKSYARKCFKNYGYIMNIYDIEGPIRGGFVRAEDTTCSSLHRVKFRCKLCNPLKRNKFVAKVTGINKMLIFAETGPIKFMITNYNINAENIVYVNTKAAFFPKNKNGEILDNPISIGSHIIVELISKKIANGDEQIMTMGRLEAIASDSDIKQAIKYEFSQQNVVDINTYLDQENSVQQLHDTQHTATESAAESTAVYE